VLQRCLPTRATIDDWMKYDGKAELIGGKIVSSMPIGIRRNRVAANGYSTFSIFEQ